MILGFVFAPAAMTVGFFTGLAYALLAAGLVLVYRATGVINFAHGQIGALCAFVLALLSINYGVPYPLALGAALLLGAGIGAAVEAGVIRRLSSRSRLVLLVATIGVTQVVLVVQLLLPKVYGDFPVPINRTYALGTVLIRGEHFLALAVAPAVMVALALFLRTPQGLAIRAVAKNREAAALAGIDINRISMLVWVIAGGLSALTAILITPMQGSSVGLLPLALGPGLLLRALGAGLLGGLENLPRALAGGIAIGVLEALLFTNYPTSPGIVDLILFLAILGMLLRLPRRTSTDDRSVAGAQSSSGPIEWTRPWMARVHLSQIALGIAVVLPFVVTTSSGLFLWTRVLVFAIAALSVTVLTGWAGQLSLGQFAFVGTGSVVTGSLVARGMGFLPAVGFSVVAGAVLAAVVGLPALRLSGLFLAVATLGFALAAHGYLFSLSWLLPNQLGKVIPATVGPVQLGHARPYYYFCLAALVAVLAAVARLRRTGIGRGFVAVQDNEAGAAAFSVSPTLTKLSAFALSGAVAGLAGGLLAGLNHQFTAADFTPALSLQIVSIAIIGGLTSPTGAVLGSVYVLGVPAALGSSAAVSLATSGIGLLVLLLFRPDGLVSFLDALRRRFSHRLAVEDRPSVVVEAAATDPHAPTTTRRPLPRTDAARALVVRDVSVAFGGRHALDRVSLHAERGEIIGLIGANGAGKSTLMNVVSGLQPATGVVEVFGRDVSPLAPHSRARVGVGRAFQNAALFPSLTVTETIALAFEVHDRSAMIPSLLGLAPSVRAEAAKQERCEQLVHTFGLGRYATSFIAELSTGTRRIVELACLVAMESALILLDEPTAGVAQREAEAFVPLIRRIRDDLDATVVLIEHDIGLVATLSDRIYCLGAGQVIAEGETDEVRHDPAVVAAYLGTDDRAMTRSTTS